MCQKYIVSCVSSPLLRHPYSFHYASFPPSLHPSLLPSLDEHASTLSLCEIVLIIGQFIPIWESLHSADRDLWLFKPKDLFAVISVNRLFHATLTPLLWSVYVESAVKLRGDHNLHLGHRYHYIPFDSVQKNSSYIRFLDLSKYSSRRGQVVEPLELNCSRLQELRLSDSIDFAWAKCLIFGNPELRVLHWARTHKKFTQEQTTDFESVLSLRRLQSLGLQNWNFLTPYLYRALAKNAEHLEKLRLTRCNSIVPKRSKRYDTGRSQTTFITSREEGIEEFEMMKKMCGRIRLATSRRSIWMLSNSVAH